MKRPRKPLPRGAPPKRSGKPNAVNRARKAREFARAYGSEERVEWIKAQPSVISGHGPCENVHVRGGGGSRKADACWIVPMTPVEHRALHSWGKRRFEKLYSSHGPINLDILAGRTNRRWHMHLTENAQ